MTDIWFLSFSSTEKHLGVVVTPRQGSEELPATLLRLHAAGINPGGAVMGGHASPDTYIDSGEGWVLRPDMQNRLIPEEESRSMGYPVLEIEQDDDTAVEFLEPPCES